MFCASSDKIEKSSLKIHLFCFSRSQQLETEVERLEKNLKIVNEEVIVERKALKHLRGVYHQLKVRHFLSEIWPQHLLL